MANGVTLPFMLQLSLVHTTVLPCGIFNNHPRFTKFLEDKRRVVFHLCGHCYLWLSTSTEFLFSALCHVVTSCFHKHGPQLLTLISIGNCGKQPVRWPLNDPPLLVFPILYDSLPKSNLLLTNRNCNTEGCYLHDQMTKDNNFCLARRLPVID